MHPRSLTMLGKTDVHICDYKICEKTIKIENCNLKLTIFIFGDIIVVYYAVTCGGITVAICYKKLWKLLIDRDMQKKDLASCRRSEHECYRKARQEPECIYRSAWKNLQSPEL